MVYLVRPSHLRTGASYRRASGALGLSHAIFEFSHGSV